VKPPSKTNQELPPPIALDPAAENCLGVVIAITLFQADRYIHLVIIKESVRVLKQLLSNRFGYVATENLKVLVQHPEFAMQPMETEPITRRVKMLGKGHDIG
tara:strand:+ start:133 stop:438 length:306 start_codon:yes stop_codon:yes gene_type:complete